MITLGKTEAVHISIYHIGYSSEGESSLFILHTLDKKVLYSVVIGAMKKIVMRRTGYWNNGI